MKMYSDKMEKIIEMVLQDGQVLPHERALLEKQAQAEGIDLDELYVYLESIMQKRVQEQKVQMDKETAVHEKERRGNVCPRCHTEIPPLTNICPNPDCGYVIKSADNSGDKELFELIDQINQSLIKVKSARDKATFTAAKAECEAYLKKADVFYGDNKKVQMLVFDLKAEIKEKESALSKDAIKDGVIKVLTYNKKVTAGVAILLVILLWWGISALFSSPDVANDPQVCIEMVNEALADGDVAKAESYCAAFYNENKDWGDISSIDSAYDAIIKYQTGELNELIKQEDYDTAAEYLESISIMSGIRYHGTSEVVSRYDAMFYKLINVYVKNSDLDSAESMALVWRSKIDNEISWEDSSCYKLLKSEYKKNNRDFSVLLSKYDYDN